MSSSDSQSNLILVPLGLSRKAKFSIFKSIVSNNRMRGKNLLHFPPLMMNSFELVNYVFRWIGRATVVLIPEPQSVPINYHQQRNEGLSINILPTLDTWYMTPFANHVNLEFIITQTSNKLAPNIKCVILNNIIEYKRFILKYYIRSIFLLSLKYNIMCISRFRKCAYTLNACFKTSFPHSIQKSYLIRNKWLCIQWFRIRKRFFVCCSSLQQIYFIHIYPNKMIHRNSVNTCKFQRMGDIQSDPIMKMER